MNVSVSVCKCLSVSVSVYQNPSVSISVCQYMSVSVNIYQYLSVALDVCQCLSLSVGVCQYLSVSVNICQCLSFQPFTLAVTCKLSYLCHENLALRKQQQNMSDVSGEQLNISCSQSQQDTDMPVLRINSDLDSCHRSVFCVKRRSLNAQHTTKNSETLLFVR